MLYCGGGRREGHEDGRKRGTDLRGGALLAAFAIVVRVDAQRHGGGGVPHRHRELRALGQRVEVVWTKEQAGALVGK